MLVLVEASVLALWEAEVLFDKESATILALVDVDADASLALVDCTIDVLVDCDCTGSTPLTVVVK